MTLTQDWTRIDLLQVVGVVAPTVGPASRAARAAGAVEFGDVAWPATLVLTRRSPLEMFSLYVLVALDRSGGTSAV